MDAQTAFENHVRARLESSFGKAVALLILATASNDCDITLACLDEPSYVRVCEAIARDQRVQDMWGQAGAEEALRHWKSVVA